MSAAVATATIPASAPVAVIPVGLADQWNRAVDRACAEGIRLVSPLSRSGEGASRQAIAQVKSSTQPTPYTVVVFAAPLAVACSCPGGRKGQRCKHAAAVLVTLGLI